MLLKERNFPKNKKNIQAPKKCGNYPKILTEQFYNTVLGPKHADRMAKCRPWLKEGAVCSGSTMFTQTVWILRIIMVAHSWSFELPYDKTNKEACAPSEDSDQPRHPPSLISLRCPHILSYPMSAQWRLWSDWVDAQADLSLHWAHSHFVGFVMRRLISWHSCTQEFEEFHWFQLNWQQM